MHCDLQELDFALLTLRPIFTGNKSDLWLCDNCRTAFQRHEMPPLCVLNHLDLREVPEELRCLTIMELRLVTMVTEPTYTHEAALHCSHQWLAYGAHLPILSECS